MAIGKQPRDGVLFELGVSDHSKAIEYLALSKIHYQDRRLWSRQLQALNVSKWRDCN